MTSQTANMIPFENRPPMPRCFLTVVIALLLAAGVSLGAQQAAAGGPQDAGDTTIAERHEIVAEKNHHYIGKVELEQRGGETKIYADEAWFYSDENRFAATGNVVFSQGNNRIAADRVDFNTSTRIGTFYNATGILSVQPPKPDARAGGLSVPQISGQETNV